MAQPEMMMAVSEQQQDSARNARNELDARITRSLLRKTGNRIQSIRPTKLSRALCASKRSLFQFDAYQRSTQETLDELGAVVSLMHQYPLINY
jgi:hypothetical protein